MPSRYPQRGSRGRGGARAGNKGRGNGPHQNTGRGKNPRGPQGGSQRPSRPNKPRYDGPGRSGPGSSRPAYYSTPKHNQAPRQRRGPNLRPEIVYEDADVLVIAKPAGLLSASPEPGDIRTPSAFLFAKKHVKAHPRRGRARPRVWIIHRLDREASGLMVFAKSEKAFEHLKEELRARRMHRIYQAVVVGTFDDPRSPEDRAKSPLAGTIKSYLCERYDRSMECVRPDDVRMGDAKEAITHYRIEDQGRGMTLLLVRLESGRKHQIRVQLASIGHPVAGDRVYGGEDHQDPCGRLALHACELGFAHPIDGRSMRFQHEPPRVFFKAIGRKPDSAETKPSDGEVSRNDQGDPTEQTQTHSSWDHVAEWYDSLLDQRSSDHHHRVIVPGTLRLLEPREGQRVLDVACGQGVLAAGLVHHGANVVGLDLSPKLIDAAHGHLRPAGSQAEFLVMDARDLSNETHRLGGAGSFDAAALVMAAMNIDPIEPVFAGVRTLLRTDGRFVIVMLHPSFRAPQQTAWHWEEDESGDERCVRTVSGYLSTFRSSIVMNPGQAARGRRAVTTWTYHRPLQMYVAALAHAGFTIDMIEEWTSQRASEPGRRASEENRSRREIPLFMAIRAVARGSVKGSGSTA